LIIVFFDNIDNERRLFDGFPSPFPETLQNVWGRIYSKWFLSSGCEAVKGLGVFGIGA